MVNIEFIGGNTFTINNITLVRNFHSYVHGNKLRIVNAYDTRNELLPYTQFSDISVNGTIYGTAAELAEILAPVLFLKQGGSDTGNVPVLGGNIITKVVPVPIDWTQDSIQQIVDFVNAQEFVVPGTQRTLFKAVRIIGDIETSNAAEFYFWEFKPGKGTYGINGTDITSTDIEYTSFVTNYQNNVINLGEIGATPIEVHINGSGPYGINTASLNVFKTLRQGNPANYIFIGSSNSIGLGQTQTVSGDFIDVNATPVNPPSQTVGLDVPNEEGYIPISTVDGGLYWVKYEPGTGGVSNPGTTAHGITYFVSGWDTGLSFVPTIYWDFMGASFQRTKRVTSPAADATYDRIDVMAVTSDGDIIIIPGTPSANPEKPVVDPTLQIEATFFLIKAGAATPDGADSTKIYDESGEYVDGEWKTETFGYGVTINSPTDSFSGIVSIEGTNVDFLLGQVVFTPPTPIARVSMGQLQLRLKNKKVILEQDPFRILVRGIGKNGKSAYGLITNFENFGWDRNNLTDWQFLSFDIANTIGRVDTIQEFKFLNYAPTEEANGFFLDNVRYVTGITEEVDLSGYASKEEMAIGDAETLQAAKDYADQLAGADAGSSVKKRYATWADLLADQAVQLDKGIYYAADASADPTVDTGYAYYEYLGTTNGTLADYRKLSEEESMDVDPGGLDVRMANLVADLSTAEKDAIKAKLGITSGLTQDDIDEVILVDSSRALTANDIGKILFVVATVTLTYPTGGIPKMKFNLKCTSTGLADIAGDAADLDLPDGQIIEAGKSVTFFCRPDDNRLTGDGEFTA